MAVGLRVTEPPGLWHLRPPYDTMVSMKINGFAFWIVQMFAIQLCLSTLTRGLVAHAEEPSTESGSAGVPPNHPSDIVPASTRRIALVVGIGGYSYARDLPYAVSDAGHIAEALKEGGFLVRPIMNASRHQLMSEIEEFAERVKEGDIVVIYWSGHGIQVDGEGWLLPSDAAIDSPAQVPGQAIPLTWLIRRLNNSRAAQTVLFLDACRANPIDPMMKMNTCPAPMEMPSDNLILSFASRSNHLARLTDDDHASAYSRALYRQLAWPQPLDKLLERLRADVAMDTHDEEIPWHFGSMSPSSIYLVSPLPVPPISIASAYGKATYSPPMRSVGLTASVQRLHRWMSGEMLRDVAYTLSNRGVVPEVELRHPIQQEGRSLRAVIFVKNLFNSAMVDPSDASYFDNYYEDAEIAIRVQRVGVREVLVSIDVMYLSYTTAYPPEWIDVLPAAVRPSMEAQVKAAYDAEKRLADRVALILVASLEQRDIPPSLTGIP